MANFATLLAPETVAAQWGGKNAFVIQKEFDLSALASVLATGDTVDLFTLPAKHTVLSATLETTGAATMTGTTPTMTLQARAATTTVGAAVDSTTAGAIGAGNTAYVGNAATTINVIATLGGTTPVVTKNPKVKLTLVLLSAA